jgi:hypothetical protein
MPVPRSHRWITPSLPRNCAAVSRRRFTNRCVDWHGETVVVTVRLPRPVVDSIDDHLGQPDLRTRSDALQDASAIWCLMEERFD